MGVCFRRIKFSRIEGKFAKINPAKISCHTVNTNLYRNGTSFVYLEQKLCIFHTSNISQKQHRRPKLKTSDKHRERDFSVSAYKVVLCYNGLNHKDFYGHRQPRRVVCGVHLKIEKGENICNSTK